MTRLTIEFTDWAKDILQRADAGARRLNPDARVRLVRAGTAMEAVLADTPGDGDEVLSIGKATIFVESGLQGRGDQPGVGEPREVFGDDDEPAVAAVRGSAMRSSRRPRRRER